MPWTSHNGETSLTIHQGDALDVLRSMPDESVHCCVTSPPYYALRDYGCEGQIGLEETPEAYVAKLVEVFREVKRVLRGDGTLWLVIGDSYAAGKPRTDEDCESGGMRSANRPSVLRADTLKPKDMIGVPWMLAFALRADGWWLRRDIVWAKGCSFGPYVGNPMPESVTDRPTSAHEYVFLLSKAERYFYDKAAVLESLARPDEFSRQTPAKFGGAEKHEGYGTRKHSGNEYVNELAGRNLRSVWTIPTHPYPEAHFATFPAALVEPCIKAGTSEKGCCPKCGAPWVRISEKSRTFESGSGKAGHIPVGKHGSFQGGGETLDLCRGPVVHSATIGWQPTCACDLPPQPCTVLDPFAGSGTTLLVAQRLGRNAIGIELNPDYCQLAQKRLAEHRQMKLPLEVA